MSANDELAGRMARMGAARGGPVMQFRQSGGQIAEIMAAEPCVRREPALAPFRTGDPGKRMDTLVPTPEWKAFTIAARERGLSISLMLRLAARAYLGSAPGIPWVPIADMPEDWKDRRQVLAWDGTQTEVVRWYDDEFHIPEGYPLDGITHVADINPPEGL